jgi:hypothetical protein
MGAQMSVAALAGAAGVTAASVAAIVESTRADLATDIESARADLAADIVGLNDPTASNIADVVWDELQADHVGAGTMGAQMSVAALAGAAGLTAASCASIVESTRADLANKVESSRASLIATVPGNVWDELQSSHSGSGTMGGQMSVAANMSAAIGAFVESARADVATDIAALDFATQAEVESARADLATDIAALNDPTASAIADQVWDEIQSGHVGAGTMGAQMSAAAAGGGGGVSAGSVASAVWDASQASHIGAGTMGAQLSDAAAGTGGSAALGADDYSNIADNVWNRSQANHVASGSMGVSLAIVAGRGDTEVDHNYPTSDNLRVLNQDSDPVSGATISAFLKTDYDAGNRGTGYLKGRTSTLDDGRWAQPIYLATGVTYTIQVTKSGSIEITTTEITV